MCCNKPMSNLGRFHFLELASFATMTSRDCETGVDAASVDPWVQIAGSLPLIFFCVMGSLFAGILSELLIKIQ